MTKSRLVLLSILLVAFQAPACKKKPAEPIGPAVEQVRAPAEKEVPQPTSTAGTPAPVSAESKGSTSAQEPPRPFIHLDPKQYNYISPPGIPFGPPTPLIGRDESISAAQLAEWTELPVAEPEGEYVPKQFPTPRDAALDLTTLNNRGELLFQLIVQRDSDTILRKYLPAEFAYNEFLRSQGVEETTGKHKALEERLKAQFDELAPTFGAYVGPLGRKDRFSGLLMDDWARLSRWRFAYQDANGERKEGCILFLLSELSWRLLDMKCSEKPWQE